MTNEQFLQQFGHFVDAPNGIQKLRELILQLAVQGKLVIQDRTDEPASQLLENMAAYKAELINNKQIRKNAPLSKITSEDIRHLLPPGWSWVRLGDIGDWGAGATPNRKDTSYYGGTIPWFKSGELTGGHICSSEEYVTEKALKECSLRLNSPGDVLIAMYGATIGKVALLDNQATTNQAVCACTPYKGLYNEFLLVLLKAYKELFTGQGAGGAQPNISRVKIVNTVAALPPTAEQHRIVAKVDELMSLCDQLETERNAREETHQRLIRAAHHPLTEASDTATTQTAWHRIRDNFANLYTTPKSVQAFRQTILQLAVQGKLTHQDASEEPASVLIEHSMAIKAQMLKDGTIKKGKAIPSLGPKSLPYSLSEGWKWAVFDDVVNVVGGVTKGRKLAGRKVGSFPYLRVANVQRGWLDLDQIKEIEIPLDELEKYSLKKGDLLITEGGDWDKVGRTAIWNEEIDPCLHQNHVFRARVINPAINRSYLMLYLNSPVSREYFAGSSKQTTNLASINMTQLRSAPIPIPPAVEQKRIVDKVNDLMALCDQLEANISNQNDVASKYTEAVIHRIAAA